MKLAYKKIKNSLPSYNQYLIYDYKKQQLQDILKTLDAVWKDIVILSNDSDLEYHGYRIMEPVERALYEINNSSHIKNSISILSNEMYLVQFQFTNYGQKEYVHVFLPYLFENAIVINDTRYYLEYLVLEKIFFKIRNGFNMKVKLPINFQGYKKISLFTSEEGYKLFDNIINVKIHNKKKASIDKITIMHYLLAQFGFTEILNLFGCDKCVKVGTEKIADIDWVNFDVTPKKSKNKIYLHVKTEEIESTYIYKKVVSSILKVFTLNKYQYTYDDIFEPSNTLFKILLGELIYDNSIKNILLIKNHIELHLQSLNSYMDTISIEKLSSINAKSIWDILIYCFKNFESILNGTKNNDLFNKKVDYAGELTEKLYISNLYRRIYTASNKNTYTKKNINNIKILEDKKRRKINEIYKLPNISAESGIYNDNLLINHLRACDSVPGKDTNFMLKNHMFKIHISFPFIKNLNALSTSSPHKNSILNMYGEIDKNGNIIKSKKELLDTLYPLLKY